MSDSSESIVTDSTISAIEIPDEYKKLNELGFVMTESPEEQWLLLVSDAWEYVGAPINYTLREYLARMLERYSLQADLYHRLSLFNFMMYFLNDKNVDPLCMPEIADIGLIYLSLVPERSKHRHEMRRLNHSMMLCEALYTHLATMKAEKDDVFSLGYKEIAKQFDLPLRILRSVKLPSLSKSLLSFDKVFQEPNDVEEQFALITGQTRGKPS